MIFTLTKPSLRQMIRRVIPVPMRRILVNLREDFIAARLMSSKRYRDAFIYETINEFKPNHEWAVRGGKCSFHIAAYWDADGRFRWLYEPALEKNIGLLHVPRSIYRPVFAKLFQRNGYKPDNRKGEVSLSVFYEDRFRAARKEYTQYCQDVAESIARQFSINIFLLFKLNDDWIIDVIRGIRQSGNLVVVHDREHGIIKKRMKVYPPYLREIREDLRVNRLCLTNHTHYKFFELCGFPSSMLALTGKPDVDAWFRGEQTCDRKEISTKLREDSILLIFFAFGRYNYLNFFYKGERRDWGSLADDYHNILLELLAKFGDKLQIVYKIGGKPARDNYPGFDKFINAVTAMGREDALVILDGSTSTIDLLKVSDAVLAFHTLGLVEAMFTNKPIFYGAWGGLFNDIKHTLLPFHEWHGLDFKSSKKELSEALSEFFENPGNFKISDEVQKFRLAERESMYYSPDGDSSNRLLNVIEDVVSEEQSKSLDSQVTRLEDGYV